MEVGGGDTDTQTVPLQLRRGGSPQRGSSSLADALEGAREITKAEPPQGLWEAGGVTFRSGGAGVDQRPRERVVLREPVWREFFKKSHRKSLKQQILGVGGG